MLNLGSIGTLPEVRTAVAGGQGLLLADCGHCTCWPVCACEMLAQGVGIDLNALAGVPQEALLPQMVHLERDDFARGADVLRNHLVGQRRNLDGAVLGAGAEPLGKTQQGADDALRGLVEREALQPLLVIEAALDQHLQQGDAEARLPLDLFLDFARWSRT